MYAPHLAKRGKRPIDATLTACALLLSGWLTSLGLVTAPARAIDPDEIPNPLDRGSSVSDTTDRLSQPAELLLDDTIDAYHDRTHRDIAVVIVPNVASNTPKQLAAEFRNAWGIGQDVKDGGILLLISADGQAAVDLGSSLSFPPSQRDIDRLLETHVLPEIENDNYDRAAISGVNALIETLDLSSGELFALDLWVKVGTAIVVANAIRYLVAKRRAQAGE